MKMTVKKIKKDQMGWTCGTHGVEERFMKDSGGERDGEMAGKS
jgi:hypothetical protein